MVTPLFHTATDYLHNVLWFPMFCPQLLAARQGQTVNQIFHSHLHNETLKNLPWTSGTQWALLLLLHLHRSVKVAPSNFPHRLPACVRARDVWWFVWHSEARAAAVSVSTGRNLLRRAGCVQQSSDFELMSLMAIPFFWHFLGISATFAYAKLLWRQTDLNI